MNDQPKTELSIWERSTIVRASRWVCSWRGIRRILIVLAWAVTILGLFYGEEDWRGRRAWNQYRTPPPRADCRWTGALTFQNQCPMIRISPPRRSSIHWCNALMKVKY